jgi:hypothetical protein
VVGVETSRFAGELGLSTGKSSVGCFNNCYHRLAVLSTCNFFNGVLDYRVYIFVTFDQSCIIRPQIMLARFES